MTAVAPREAQAADRATARPRGAIPEHKQLVTDDRVGPKWAIYLFGIAPTFFVPFLFFGLAWFHLITPLEAWIQLGMAYFTILGVTAGFHRYFTHESYEAPAWFESVLAIAASMAIQGGVLQWCADHKYHHAYSDTEDDLHSPWNGVDAITGDDNRLKTISEVRRYDRDHGPKRSLGLRLARMVGFRRHEVMLDPDDPWSHGTTKRALFKGMIYSHMGWLPTHKHAPEAVWAPKLVAKRHLVAIDNTFIVWVLVSLIGPSVAVGLISWSLRDAIVMAGLSLIRMTFVLHVTWLTNSLCHISGTRPTKSLRSDRSSNNWWLWLLSLGENFHNNHHGEPTCAWHGGRWYNPDVTFYVIWLSAVLGITHDVRMPGKRVWFKRKLLAPDVA